MRKRITSLLLAAALALSMLVVPAGAAFNEIREYQPGTFTDIGGWSESYIKQCYELGLLNGVRENTFQPGGLVSIAQVLTLAVRLQDIYNGGSGEIPNGSVNWYDTAVELAIEKKIISAGEYSSYTQPASRAEVASILTRALPESELKPINNITSLPDVKQDTPFAQAIFTLYNAGALSGSDIYGSYHPNGSLTREALAAILTRICIPSTRLTLTFPPKPADMTARSSSLLLDLGGYTTYGIITVDGEYYIPLECLSLPLGPATHAPNQLCIVREGYGGTTLYLDRYWNRSEEVHVSYTAAPPDGRVIGTAEAAPDYIASDTLYQQGSDSKTVKHLTVGGFYPMIRISDIADGDLTIRNGTLFAPFQSKATPSETKAETDLLGTSLKKLARDNDYDTIKSIHDYIVNTLTYHDGKDQTYDIVSEASKRYMLMENVALESKYGICEDYADVFWAMCIRAGIPCERVTGYAGEAHAWNRVYLNGSWQFVDCTWDDPIGKQPVLRYDYFLKPAIEMVKTHSWTDADYPLTTTYDPAWAKIDPNNISTADMFRQCMVAQMFQYKPTFTLHVTTPGAYGGTAYAYTVGAPYMSFTVKRSGSNYIFTVNY